MKRLFTGSAAIILLLALSCSPTFAAEDAEQPPPVEQPPPEQQPPAAEQPPSGETQPPPENTPTPVYPE